MKALLREAARWRLLGMLFERPRPGWLREIRALAAEVDDDALARAAGDAEAATEGAYLAVLGPGGAVSPREVAYRAMSDPGRVLSALAGFYAAFGYRPRTEEPDDHVAVQAGFVGFLALKQAYAMARGDAERAEEAARARRMFLERHLGGFAGELERRLSSVDVPHLVRAARALSASCPRSSPVDPLRVVAPPVDADTCGCAQ